MELPFTSFELTFIIIAFLVFSLFGVASTYNPPGRANITTCSNESHRKPVERVWYNSVVCFPKSTAKKKQKTEVQQQQSASRRLPGGSE
uniref:Secreted protein n=1 Tax=Oryzias latipes TaxID=8090 RepID=A0A3P9MED4_ORYLA